MPYDITSKSKAEQKSYADGILAGINKAKKQKYKICRSKNEKIQDAFRNGVFVGEHSVNSKFF